MRNINYATKAFLFYLTSQVSSGHYYTSNNHDEIHRITHNPIMVNNNISIGTVFQEVRTHIALRFI